MFVPDATTPGPRLDHRQATALVPGRVERLVLADDLVVLGLLLAGSATHGGIPEGALWVLGLTLVGSAASGHYAVRKSLVVEARELVLATATALAGGLGIGALFGSLEPAAPLVWFAVAACLALLAGRILLKQVLHLLGLWQRPVLVLGPVDRIEDFRLAIERNWYLGDVVQSCVDAGQPPEAVAASLAEQVRFGGVGHVAIIIDPANWPAALQLASWLDHAPCTTYSLVLPVPELASAPVFLERPLGHDGLVLSCARKRRPAHHAVLKRGLDLVLATALLVVLAPLLLAVGLMIRRDGGPALYGSARIGRGGRQFKAWKFRSMVPDAECRLRELLASDPAARREWQARFKLTRDPRITPIGRFLRQTSLDELPQLLNVVKGEMSLVGPRPILLDEYDKYGEGIARYQQSVPGMTGMWQVCGRDELDYEQRIRLNNWYHAHATLWTELAIMLRTAVVVLRRLGAS